jgi:hypothetical protein
MSAAVLYVYYKVALDEHARFAQRVRICQADLRLRWAGLEAELLQRPEASDGKETWMEAYRYPQGISAELQAAIHQAAVDAELPMPRHTERFIALR